MTRLGGVLLVLGVIVPRPAYSQAADSVTLRVVPYRSTVKTGDRIPIAIVFQYPKGLHSWPHEPVVPPEFAGVNAIATTIESAKTEGIEVGAIQWPDADSVTVRYTRRPVKLSVYAGRAIAYVPVHISRRQAGQIVLKLSIGYQPCDETMCYAPRTVVRQVSFKVARDAPTAPAGESELFRRYRRNPRS